MEKKKRDKNGLALLLLLPIFIFYTGYFLNYAPGYKPTGFIQYDNIGYVAFAKQYSDHPGLTIGYSNPLNDSGNYPKVYFQTQTLMLAIMLRAGIDPGITICLFSILFCFLAIRTIISVFDELYPDSRHRSKILLLLVWGGGLISLSCMLLRPFMSTSLTFWSSIYYLDPEDGWWGLNFGRSLIFGTESYYHFLFFTSILFLLRKKWLAASAVAFILSFSHPFTGIHLLLVILAWVGAEKIVFKNKTIPWWLLGSTALLLLIHLCYYLIYLPSFPDHKSVSDQYSVNWNYRNYRALPVFIPAYIIVFFLFILSLRIQRIKKFAGNSNNRLLVCLGIVSLLLCNHDLFMKPMQPIHFARGYEWTAYFLLGVPAILYLFNYFLSIKKLRWVLYLFILVFLSDNLLWVANYVRTSRGNETTLSDGQAQIIDVLKPNTDNNMLLIGSDAFLMFYSSVYTRGYPWISHPYTTPFFLQKKEAYTNFIRLNKIDTAWIGRKLIFVFDKADSLELKRSQQLTIEGEILLENSRYKVVSGSFH
jgi:hypothetical protein